MNNAADDWGLANKFSSKGSNLIKMDVPNIGFGK